MKETAPIRILVIDDHLPVRLGISAIIEGQPDMMVVADGAAGDAVAGLYEQHQPDVVLLDLRLPGMSGIEVIKQLRERFTAPRILVLTTLDREEDIFQAIEAGARGYLLKDMRKEELLEAIRTVRAGGHWVASAASARLAERVAHSPLSSREKEVLQLIVRGKANKEIAQELCLSEDTVKWHMKSLFVKMRATDRTHAAVLAIQRGLVEV